MDLADTLSKMENRRLVESLLAVAGVWLLVRQFPDYATAVYLAASGDLPVSAAGPGVIALQSVHFLVSAAAGAALVLARRYVAHWIHPEGGAVPRLGQPMFAAGEAVMAVYFVISELLSLSALLAWNSGGSRQTSAVWRGASSVAFGLSLLVATRWIARLWPTLYGDERRGA